MKGLAVDVGRLSFRNPFLVGSGPTTRTVEQLLRADGAGWAGASIKLAIDPFPYISLPPRYKFLRREGLHGFTAETRLNMEEGLKLVEEAKKRLSKEFVLFANITHAGEEGPEGWGRMAERFASAGADAVELNMCCPNMSFNVELTRGGKEEGLPSTGASLGMLEKEVARVVRKVTARTSVPVWVKLTPEGAQLSAVARAAIEAGAECVGGTANRLGVMPFDIERPKDAVERLQKEPSVACLSGRWLLPLALRDVFELRRALGEGPGVCGFGGVWGHREAVQMILMGADVVGVCTRTMVDGFGFLEGVLESFARHMRKMGYARVREMRGLVEKEVRDAERLTIGQGCASVDPESCTACGACMRVGHCEAITEGEEGRPVIDRDRCKACGTCADVCPAGAIVLTKKDEDR